MAKMLKVLVRILRTTLLVALVGVIGFIVGGVFETYTNYYRNAVIESYNELNNEEK